MKNMNVSLALGIGWLSAAVAGAATAYMMGGAGLASAAVGLLTGFCIALGLIPDRE